MSVGRRGWVSQFKQRKKEFGPSFLCLSVLVGPRPTGRHAHPHSEANLLYWVNGFKGASCPEAPTATPGSSTLPAGHPVARSSRHIKLTSHLLNSTFDEQVTPFSTGSDPVFALNPHHPCSGSQSLFSEMSLSSLLPSPHSPSFPPH